MNLMKSADIYYLCNELHATSEFDYSRYYLDKVDITYNFVVCGHRLNTHFPVD